MNTLAVTGATGFLGQHLLDFLADRGDIQVRALIHRNRSANILSRENLVAIEGDLENPETLNELMQPGCTVVNLVYLGDRSKRKNLDAMENLAQTCARARVKRLVHCSTAVVVGGARHGVITESTPCHPTTEYEATKLAVEEIFQRRAVNDFEVAILRPTAVFGPGGKNLLKLANDLMKGKRTINYLKSCLFNHRRMNLVYVANVVSAIAFLTEMAGGIGPEVFIVSDDEDPSNNYRDVEKYLMKSFEYADCLVPRIPLPPFALAVLLRLAGRSHWNPSRVYSCEKLLKAGFRKPVAFGSGLAFFADWYKDQFYRNVRQANS